MFIYNLLKNNYLPPQLEILNVYKLIVTASDGLNSTNSSEISITVLEVNNPPQISDLPSSITLDETSIDVVQVNASDPEGNALTFNISGTDASSFTFNSSNTLSFSSVSDYENPTDSNLDNVYEVTFMKIIKLKKILESLEQST